MAVANSFLTSDSLVALRERLLPAFDVEVVDDEVAWGRVEGCSSRRMRGGVLRHSCRKCGAAVDVQEDAILAAVAALRAERRAFRLVHECDVRVGR